MTQKRISSFTSRTAAISLALAFAATAAWAQKPAAKSAATTKMQTQAADSIPLLRGIALSADIIGLAENILGSHGQYEGQVRLNLRDKYFPVVEVGYGRADTNDPTTRLTYKTSAPYARIGADFNIARNKHDDYRLYIGARYALTYYKFDVTAEGLKDPVWGDDASFEAKGIKANWHWMEAVFGVDAKICGPLRLGWSLRYKRRITGDKGNIGNTWYIPGFGKQGNSKFGGTFNVTFEI